jgi:catechol 2,3-dioxygenase-like lactoylglutathione lyase family enzyme
MRAMGAPQLSNVILRVASLDDAVAFWNGTLGLAIVSRSEAFAFLDAGAATLALNAAAGGDPHAVDSMTEIVLEVDDPRSAFDAWKGAGVGFLTELRPVIEQDGRSLLAAHARDPDGHLFSLTGWE